MIDETGAALAHRHGVALVIFGVYLSFYLLSASGRPFSTDGENYYRIAESLALRRTVAVLRVPDSSSVRVGPDGQLYTKYALGQAIAEAPLVLALRPAVEAFAPSEQDRARAMRTWVPIATNALVSAATVALVYLAVVGLGYSAAIGLAVSLLFGLSTMAWPYARWDFSEPLQGLLLLLAFLALRRVRPASWSWAIAGVGGALAGLVLTKAVYGVVIPVFGLAVLWQVRRAPLRTIALAVLGGGLPVTLGLAAYLAYNYARSGSPLDFAYNEPFSTPILVGLYGLLFSSGKGVFLYCPVLVASALAAPAFFRKHPLEALTVGVVAVLLLGTYAQFWSWHGDWGWGPRFLTPLLPLLMLPLAPVLAAGRRAWTLAVVALGFAGVFVQTLGVAIDPGNYLSVQMNQVKGPGIGGSPSYDDLHYAPYFSPLAGHWWLLTASVEQLISPRKTPAENQALQAFPWKYAEGRPGWRPPHPEYGLGIDLWLIRARPQSLRWTLLLALGMAAPGLAALLGTGALAYAHARRPRRVPSRPVAAADV